MPTPLDDVCRALLPRSALPLLAPLRREPGVRVALGQDDLWVSWDVGNDRALHVVLPLPGVKLFAFCQGRWQEPGHHLPALDMPRALSEQLLDRLLFPAPIRAMPPGVLASQPLNICLVPDDRPRPTTALTCGVPELAAWADTVSAARLARLTGLRCAAGILVLGDRLPWLPGALRWWGQEVFFPLGFRPEPALPASAVRDLLHLDHDELALVGPERILAAPRTLASPLGRAELKLSLEMGEPRTK